MALFHVIHMKTHWDTCMIQGPNPELVLDNTIYPHNYEGNMYYTSLMPSPMQTRLGISLKGTYPSTTSTGLQLDGD
jgi:hypothetical protein